MQVVKYDFLQALGEVAEELGGEEFADRVLTASYSDSIVPAVPGFQLLRDAYPESTPALHARITEIGEQRRSEGRDAITERFKPGLIGNVRLAVEGIKSFRL